MECGICFESYNNSSKKPYNLYKCGHTYCIECLNKGKYRKCPMCSEIIVDKTISYSILQMIKPEPDNSPGNNSKSVLSFDLYEKKILEILEKNTTNIPIIFQKIESECGVIDCHSKVLIRALVTAVCLSCIHSKKGLAVFKFIDLCSLLSMFVNGNQEYEVETIFAIKSLQQKMSYPTVFIDALLYLLKRAKVINENNSTALLIIDEWRLEFKNSESKLNSAAVVVLSTNQTSAGATTATPVPIDPRKKTAEIQQDFVTQVLKIKQEKDRQAAAAVLTTTSTSTTSAATTNTAQVIPTSVPQPAQPISYSSLLSRPPPPPTATAAVAQPAPIAAPVIESSSITISNDNPTPTNKTAIVDAQQPKPSNDTKKSAVTTALTSSVSTPGIQRQNTLSYAALIDKNSSIENSQLLDLFTPYIQHPTNAFNKYHIKLYNDLVLNLTNLPINSEDRLKCAIDIIFEKIANKQIHRQTYAELCKVLSPIKAPSNTHSTMHVNFRAMLLNRCQKEFNTDYYQEMNYDKLIMEIDQCTDELKKHELKELVEKKLSKAKQRSLGNILFIGDLFKLNMLTEGIINDCIERLLKQDDECDEENIEELCCFLTNIGKEIDKPNNANKMNSYFERLNKITKKKETATARIRFMILKLLDLRKNKWVPRRKDNKPSPLEEIRKEPEQQQQRLVGGFGWNKSAQSKQFNLNDSASSVSTLTSSSASFSDNTSSLSLNYSKHGDDYYDIRSNLTAGDSLNRIDSVNQSGSLALNKLNKKNSSDMTSRLSIDSNKSIHDNGQVIKKIDRSGAFNLVRNDEKCRKYTYNEVDRKVISILEEYIQNKDLSEALKDCEEFKPIDSSQYVEFIEFFIQKVLERSDHTRNSIGVLFFNLIKENKIDTIYFSNAFKNVFEMAEEMAIDIPSIATYLSQIIAPLFQKDFSVDFLSDFCEPIKNRQICADIISDTLHNASNRLGHSSVIEIFSKSNLDLHDFLKGVDNPFEFIKKNNLTWLTSNQERTQSSSGSTESYEQKLFQILQPTTLRNEVILDKIESDFGEIDFQSKVFIRALVSAVCRSCLDANDKLDQIRFKNRSSILTKFIDRKEEFELEALFAIQALDHKMQHQPAFVRVLFDMLYDEDIISEGVFWTWKKEAREEGHAISALSLKSFFDWLSEPEPN